MERRDQVLIATLGAEPQVVTLMLDALHEQGFPIREAVIVHTESIAVRRAVERLKKEEAVYRQGSRQVRFLFVPVREGEHRPEDIMSERDAALLLRVLYRTVVHQKRLGRRVHLSIAGGRKVMAAYGMVVAQLLFDEDDRVWHLLSEGQVVADKVMHVDKGRVSLVPVPVLRWALLPSTLQELLVWDDPYRAIERQRQLKERERRGLLGVFWERLTPAEREVVKLLVREGGTNAELARKLGRSPKTVANQLRAIYSKYRGCLGLEASGSAIRAQLVADLALYLRS
jgi:CRISPR-associated Csx14 family protein